MARLSYSQRLLALFQETSWVVVFRWICETLRSFLQAWKANLMSKVALPAEGPHLNIECQFIRLQ